jgi:glycine/D-amino acid oxidase-like deaminating enzyme/nitrite reductase/ring-hydroxylating ferredoxin subunit
MEPSFHGDASASSARVRCAGRGYGATVHDPQPRTPRSRWAEALPTPAGAPAPPGAVDVVVVGAGVTGVLTASLLAEDGADVLLVDRDQVGGQATRNTTAKLSCLQGTVLSSIESSRGVEAAAAYAAANVHALDGIRSLIERRNVDCDLREAPSFTHATTADGEEKAQREFEVALAAGLPVTWTTDTDLPFDVVGAVRLDGQAHIHPVKLCLGLADQVGEARVLPATTVVEVEEHADRCEVHLASGSLVRAEHVVVATQAPVVDPGLLSNRCHPEQSYALSARVPAPTTSGMFLSSDEASRSIRPVVAGAEHVLVLGGGGHAVGAPEAGPERWSELEAWAAEHWPGLEVTHRWATHDLVPSDHVPFIGRLAPGAQRRWVATGFQKWGMTNAYVAAHLLAEQIGGREVAWQDTFDATRLRDSLTGDLVSAGVRVGRRMVGDRIRARRSDVDLDDLEVGCGTVTSVGGQDVAIHRGPEGISAVAAACTHQGCLVAFDAATQTWDCPCHGSRFDVSGTVVQGPAIDGLQPVELD